MSFKAIGHESDEDSFHSCEVMSDVEIEDCENNASIGRPVEPRPEPLSLAEKHPQRRRNKRVVLDDDLSSDSEAEGEQIIARQQPQDVENNNLVSRVIVGGKTYVIDFSYESTESEFDEEEERDENDPRAANSANHATPKNISVKTIASNRNSSVAAATALASIYFDEEAQEASASEEEVDSENDDGSVLENETLATFTWSSGSKDWTISSTMTKYRLPRVIGDSLYDYQRDGVSFLLGVWESTMNAGILADDMGLGKTNQSVAAICTLFSSMKIKNCLVISPLAVMEKWRSLLANQLVHAGQQVHVFHGPNKEKVLSSFRARGSCGVLVSTYETCQSNSDVLAKIGWDVLVADEASKIKNHKSQMFKSLRAIASASKRRLCITGTPFENNLGELWALFDFACDGKLFGPYENFKRIFANQIERSQYRGQSDRDKVVGAKLSKALSDAIKPYILRREKSILLGNRVSSKVDENDSTCGNVLGSEATLPLSNQSESIASSSPSEVTRSNSASHQQLEVTAPPNRPVFNSRKVDLLVWIQLSESQRQTYKAFLESEEVALALNQTQSPLAALTVLKKICDDKRLVKLSSSSSSVTSSLATDPYESSNKLKVLMGLLDDVVLDGGHKVLIFSHSKAMLEYIEKAMERRFRGEVSYLRVDGDVKVQERMRRINAFNRDEELEEREFNGKWDVLLLTSGVGALGIEVTGANRVVIFDPHWNPAVDDQAIDRAFRIGQTRNVVCYRLVTIGTVEEKMTRIQLKKTALARVILNGENQRAFSSRDDLRDLFTLSDSNESNSLMKMIEETATETVWESVEKRLEGSTEREIAEIRTQISALGTSSSANNIDEEDTRSELNVAHLAHQKVICGVSDRIALFTREHMDELEEAMRAMSTDEQNRASKVVKDAMGWLVKKNKA